MIELISIFIVALGTYGVSKLLSAYDGPFNIFLKFRQKFPLGPMVCLVCTSVWAAIPLSIFSGLTFIDYLAVIGIVILVEVKL